MNKFFKIIIFITILLRLDSVYPQVYMQWVARYNVGFSGNTGLAITADDTGNVYVTGNSHGTLTRQDLVVLKILSKRN
ncbi:MAG: SBBP repeat-containing protein [Ignavibacteria bacterium]|nr:SBBP repeat-containing protein [Ignavibacteria bacterium]